MRYIINSKICKLTAAALVLLATSGLSINTHAGVVPGVKTSQHASFRPGDFERLAIIVKPVQGGRMGMGMGMGGRGGQGQTDRLIEQGFMRTLIAHGYTLVSRTDLDEAMKEKGLDAAHMTDEKYTEEAGKLLHVSALLIVSVDDFDLSPVQRQRKWSGNGPAFGGTETIYQFTGSLSARLVKIDDNMVMWTGDMTIERTLASQNLGNTLLSSMGEAIATAFPAFPAKKD